MGLQYQIIYRKGVENGAADALSRCPPAQLAAMSVCHPQWLEEVISSYSADYHAKDLIAKLSLASDAVTQGSLSLMDD